MMALMLATRRTQSIPKHAANAQKWEWAAAPPSARNEKAHIQIMIVITVKSAIINVTVAAQSFCIVILHLLHSMLSVFSLSLWD